MRFAFDTDQIAFRDTLRAFLEKECLPDAVRESWSAAEGWSRERWRRLADMGVVGCLLPEEHGGLNLDETWLVLLLEEAGRAALPEPVGVAAVAGALLRDVGDEELSRRWLPALASGAAVVTSRTPVDNLVADAAAADLLLLTEGANVYAVERPQADVSVQPTVDRTRRLCTVAWDPSRATLVRTAADEALAAAADRALLADAAYVLGAATRLIELATDYAKQREQFGVPIGSFQAVKHHLANALVEVEFARPLVYRAAWSIATAQPTRAVDAKQANAAMARAGQVAARASLQVHGAIGYTYEHDLHLWMNRALVPAYS